MRENLVKFGRVVFSYASGQTKREASRQITNRDTARQTVILIAIFRIPFVGEVIYNLRNLLSYNMKLGKVISCVCILEQDVNIRTSLYCTHKRIVHETVLLLSYKRTVLISTLPPYIHVNNKKLSRCWDSATCELLDVQNSIFFHNPGSVSYTHLTLPTILRV